MGIKLKSWHIACIGFIIPFTLLIYDFLEIGLRWRLFLMPVFLGGISFVGLYFLKSRMAAMTSIICGAVLITIGLLFNAVYSMLYLLTGALGFLAGIWQLKVRDLEFSFGFKLNGWHLALVGFSILPVDFLSSVPVTIALRDMIHPNNAIFIFDFYLFLNLILLLSLYFEKTRKIGAVLSIIIGLFYVFVYFAWSTLLLTGTFYVAAGWLSLSAQNRK